MTTNEIIERIKQDLQKGDIKVVAADGYRYYTDTLTETINIPITTTKETAELYEKLVINNVVKASTNTGFDDLPRVSMYIGKPDTGKTYKAFEVAKGLNIEPILLMCREDLNLETLLEDFILVDGKPVFQESLALKALSGTEQAIIILDEFNTLRTGVSKTFQPLFDDTSPTFVYKGKVYNKNLNCKFIVTLNDKDKGISIVPDAILSRSRLKYFDPVPIPTMSQWTNVPVQWITELQKLYKLIGGTQVFGTRQVLMLKNAAPDVIQNHLYGLCAMLNTDKKVLDSLEATNIINKL